MKKTLSLFMVIFMLFTLVACGNETPEAEEYCWSCGGDIAKQAAFCEHCGVSLKENSTETTSNNGTTGTTQTPTDESSGTGETPPSTCNHSWKNATCTTPKTCEKCNLTEGEANGHWWHEATCTDVKICTVCLAKDPDSKPLGHSYVQGKCERCGANDTNYAQPTITANKTSLNLDSESGVVYITMTGGDSVTYDIGDTSIVNCEWGEWDGDTIPLTIYPVANGQTTVTIYIEGYNKSVTIQVSVEMPQPTITINGVGEEYRLYYPYTLEADVFYLHSAEYEITLHSSVNKMYIEVEVIAETIENNIIDSNYIGISYELRNENGVCVDTGGVYMDARYLNQKYSQIINFYVDAGNYTLIFKDMYK